MLIVSYRMRCVQLLEICTDLRQSQALMDALNVITFALTCLGLRKRLATILGSKGIERVLDVLGASWVESALQVEPETSDL